MRAVVTGGAGFIGSHLAEALRDRGDEVAVVDDLSAGFAENVPTGVELVEASVTDLASLGPALAGAEVVFHQAAHRAVPRSIDNPLGTDHANTHGTLSVLTAAREAGVRRVVCASSSSVYGGADRLPTPESWPATPRSPYAVSKLAGEQYCRVFAELFELEAVSLRYFNVFGPRQRPDSAYATVLPLFVDALRRGVPPTVHGDGLQSRDFTCVADVVTANLLAASAPAEVCSGATYNVGRGSSTSVLDMLSLVAGIMGVDPEPVFGDPRPGDVRHTRADISAARERLGYEPEVSIEDGLGETVDWLLHQSPRSSAP